MLDPKALMRLTKLFQIVGISTMGLGFPASSQVLYSVTDLGPGAAYGVNNSGQVVGQTASGDAFVYSGGAMTDLGVGCADGINTSGQVVGYSPASYGFSRAFLYSGGMMTDLGSLNGNSCNYAYGINDSGQVVGFSGALDQFGHAFLYSGGTMVSLGDLGYGISTAYAINTHAQVVGDSMLDAPDHPIVAFIYNGGTMARTGPPLAYVGPISFSTYSSARGINDAGIIVGFYMTGTQAYHAFLYNGAASDLGTLGGTSSFARGINNNNQIVGDADTGNGTDHAFLFNGQMTDLNTLINPAAGWTLEAAEAISDSGQIVGYGVNPSGQTDAFLLTPLPAPEPSLTAFGTVGATLMMLWRRRIPANSASGRGGVAVPRHGLP